MVCCRMGCLLGYAVMAVKSSFIPKDSFSLGSSVQYSLGHILPCCRCDVECEAEAEAAEAALVRGLVMSEMCKHEGCCNNN
mmetsp:Transcript_20886/g.35218  ORF Transcript_20886/g.35218 Transcript_20886/m.35218 type:complete len:81 (+) Transcript_20886:2099-2341(+)